MKFNNLKWRALPMKTSNWRSREVDKIMTTCERECGDAYNDPEAMGRKMNHMFKRANKASNMYRFWRRNYMYSK